MCHCEISQKHVFCSWFCRTKQCFCTGTLATGYNDIRTASSRRQSIQMEQRFPVSETHARTRVAAKFHNDTLRFAATFRNDTQCAFAKFCNDTQCALAKFRNDTLRDTQCVVVPSAFDEPSTISTHNCVKSIAVGHSCERYLPSHKNIGQFPTQGIPSHDVMRRDLA